MKDRVPFDLSRRERQIMDAVYRKGQASAAEIAERLPDPPTYSTVRALLRILEEKGHLKHKKDGTRYIYLPTQSRRAASRSALRRVVRTFFADSIEKTAAALLDVSDTRLSQSELDRLAKLIDHAKSKNRSRDSAL